MASKALSFDIRDNNFYPRRCRGEAQVKNLKWHKGSNIGSFEKSRKDLFNDSLSKISLSLSLSCDATIHLHSSLKVCAYFRHLFNLESTTWTWQVTDPFGMLNYPESPCLSCLGCLIIVSSPCFSRLVCLITTNVQNVSFESSFRDFLFKSLSFTILITLTLAPLKKRGAHKLSLKRSFQNFSN